MLPSSRRIGGPTNRRTRRQHGAVARRLLVAVAIVAALFGLLLAAATWGPNLMRERIARAAGDAIGREVRIGRIDVSPFGGRIAVSAFEVAATKAGAPPTVRADAVRATFAWGPLLRGTVALTEVALDAPALRVVRTGPSRFDVSDVIERFSGGPPSQRKTVWRVDRIVIGAGSATFVDRVVDRTATLAALALEASGLTNREEDAGTPASLRAKLTLDGRPASIDARATPFAPRPAVDGTVKLDALPLASLLPWLPLPPDVKPTAGTFGFELKVDARAAGAGERPSLEMSGRAAVDALSVADAAGTERIAAGSVAATLAPSRPLDGTLHLASLELRSPRVALARSADGALDWPQAAGARASAAGDPPAGGAAVAPATATAAPAPTTSPRTGPRALRIDAVRIDDADVRWTDAALPAPLALAIAPLSLHADAIAVPDLARPTLADGRAKLTATIDGDATLEADATAEAGRVRARAALAGVPLARYAPLAGPALRATVEQGRLGGKASADWNAADGRWTIADGAAELAGLRVTHPATKPATLARLAVEGVAVDGTARRVELGALTLDGATLDVRRSRDGRIDLASWFAPQETAAGSPSGITSPAKSATPPTSAPSLASAPTIASVTPSASAPPAASASPPAPAPDPRWTVVARRVAAANVDLGYLDDAIVRDRPLPRVALAVKASDVTLDPSKPVPLEATASLADGSRVGLRGTVRPQPLALDGQVRLQRVVLTHAEPYVAPYLNVGLASGQLWGGGRLSVAAGAAGGAPRVRWDGELSVNEFRAIDRASNDDFVRWSALAMPTVKVDWDPARVAESVVDVGPVAIVAFYSRIILGADGRLNLASAIADPSRDAPASLTAVPEPTARAPVTSRRAAEVPAAPAGPRPVIRVGTVRIASGDVAFTDLFIRPNYSANLTGLVGSIEAISSDRAQPSDVLITGRVDDDTPLEIVGKVDPLSANRYVDLRAVARGFDLPKLSPYSGRWAGYAIEKGKLTADVRYRIEGDRLQAENKVTINQLTFGDRVESPDATSLPVRLAVSLLKDRNGNIDLDLPIAGTLTDPEFSVSGLVWRALGNLIVRVVSSPFSFLASLGGGAGAGELSHVEFAAGDAELDDEDRRRLDGLARALQERPELSIEIAGVADPGADRDAMQRAALDRTLRSAKLARMRRADPSAELPPLADVVLDATERRALLEQAWIDGPPRGGKVPEGADLERLLMERAPIAGEQVREIAQQRAQAAREYLHETRGVAAERLYMLAPRIAEAGDARAPARVDFTVR